MKRRFLPILLILALCLSLLPVTALANAPSGQVLYVGGVQIYNTGYWTTGSNGSVTPYTEGGKPTENYIHYDADTNILTLHNAIIKDELPDTDTPAGSFINGAAIGVLNQDGNAELTIQLEGDNTIEDVSTGIYVLAPSPSTGAASLTITGSGSLTASGNINGIKVQSNRGDAILGINNAKVTATSKHGIGVSVQADSGSSASLSVEGGSLTASGASERKGIHFPKGSPQLNISESAIVRASGGIAAGSNEDDPVTPSGVGIVFNDKVGTVYGSVTLQENLTIGEGESLDIPSGASLTIDSGATLTVDGGELTGENIPTEGVVYKVTEVKLDKDSLSLEVGGTATLTATIMPDNATDQNVTWSSDTSGIVTIAPSTDTKTATITATGTGTTTIKAIVDGKSAECTVTVNAAATVQVESVSLDKTNLELTEGETAQLNATVLPETATNRNVTWSSNAPGVATVDSSGKVTAVAPGTATITVTTADGGKTATCVVTVTAATVPVTGVTLSQTQASLYCNRTPDTLALTARVAPDNATNKAMTWTSSDSAVATVDQNGIVTAVARGTAVITVTTEDGAKTATCTVTVSRYSSGGGSSSSSTSLSDRAIDDIQDARPGDTVEITLRPGRTTLEREVFEELAGQDITLEIDAGDGVLWTVNGLDIPEDTRLHDLDLDVDLGDSGIPATVLNAVTGEISTVQLSLAHDGEFGFTMTLSAPLGRDNAAYWANLYWYNERTEELEFQQAARIAEDGAAEFDLDHASDYAIVIDDRSHEPVDLPFNDVPESYWAYDAIQYVYGEGLMAGTSGSTFSPESTTTRGQIVTILWRLSGSPVVNYLMDFDDVDPAAYYAEAIRWATTEGIAGGYGGGLFGPDDPITREQLAVMLHRYAQHEGFDVSIGEDTNILSYADAFTVSEYAVSALQWACGAGIISGTGDGSTLTPQGQATRAQAAVMLMRFCENYVTW